MAVVSAARLARAPCFPAGTPVHAEGGVRAIESVRPGERVWAYDLASKQWELRPVLQVHRTDYHDQMVVVTTGGPTDGSMPDAETVEMTREHPVWVC